MWSDIFQVVTLIEGLIGKSNYYCDLVGYSRNSGYGQDRFGHYQPGGINISYVKTLCLLFKQCL